MEYFTSLIAVNVEMRLDRIVYENVFKILGVWFAEDFFLLDVLSKNLKNARDRVFVFDDRFELHYLICIH